MSEQDVEGAMSRFMEFCFGVFFLILGLGMMVSVIGLIVGIPLVVAGWAMMTGAETMGEQDK